MSTKPKAEPTVSQFNASSKIQKTFSKFKTLLMVVCVILIALLVSLILLNNHHLKTTTSNSCASNSAVINESATDLESHNTIGLNNIALGIKKLANFKSDPSCMYILTASAVVNTDYPQASDYLKQFNDDYTKDPVINGTLLKYQSVSELRHSVTLLYQAIARSLSGGTLHNKVGNK